MTKETQDRVDALSTVIMAGTVASGAKTPDEIARACVRAAVSIVPARRLVAAAAEVQRKALRAFTRREFEIRNDARPPRIKAASYRFVAGRHLA